MVMVLALPAVNPLHDKTKSSRQSPDPFLLIPDPCERFAFAHSTLQTRIPQSSYWQ
jgi:hypothetical protein